MKPKILIVEDNEIMAENLMRILKNDFEVCHATSAGEAIMKIDTFFPQIIMLDILLNGHSAFAFLNEANSYRDTSNIPIVICSDLADSLDESSLKNYGVKKIIDKALTRPSEILSSLKEVLGCETNQR